MDFIGSKVLDPTPLSTRRFCTEHVKIHHRVTVTSSLVGESGSLARPAALQT